MSPERNGTAAASSKSLIGLILILLPALYFYILAGKIDENPVPGHLGPAFWPRMVLILLMISCGIKGWEMLRARPRVEDQKERAESEVLLPANTLKLASMIALVLGAVYFMDVLGFALVNFLFLLLFMRVAGMRRKLRLFLISAVGTVFLLYLFVKVVYLPLPKGQWFFDDLTIMLYRFLRII